MTEIDNVGNEEREEGRGSDPDYVREFTFAFISLLNARWQSRKSLPSRLFDRKLERQDCSGLQGCHLLNL